MWGPMHIETIAKHCLSSGQRTFLRGAHDSRDTALDIVVGARVRGGLVVTHGRLSNVLISRAAWQQWTSKDVRHAQALTSLLEPTAPEKFDSVLEVEAGKHTSDRCILGGKLVLQRWRKRVILIMWRRAARTTHFCLWARPSQGDELTKRQHQTDEAATGQEPRWRGCRQRCSILLRLGQGYCDHKVLMVDFANVGDSTL